MQFTLCNLHNRGYLFIFAEIFPNITIMEKPRNPFILGHRISRPFFCDREDEQKKLTDAVKNGRNIVLISPRRMGKTSLTYVALHDSKEIEQKYITVFVDILQTNTLNEFTYLLGKAIYDKLLSKSYARVQSFLAALKSLKGTFGFDPLSGTPVFNIQLGDIKHPEYTLDEIFRFIEDCEKPMIVVIDEFQQITKYPEKNIEALLRSHIQKMGNAVFVFAGSEQSLLQDMFASSKRPFYNSSEIMQLGPIGEDRYVEFAKKMFSEYGKIIEEAPIRESFRLFDGNTFYMQRTMNGAFADTAEGNTCGHDTVRRAIRSMMAANEVVYREILSNISISRKVTLYAIARQRTVVNPMSGEFIKKHALPSSSSVQSALQSLIKSGLVSRSDTGYSLTDPLLRIFINNLYSTPEI